MKKRIKQYISWFLILALVAVLALLPVLAGNEEAVTGPQASILSGTTSRQNLSSLVIGGGTLTSQKSLNITIPAEVKLTEYLVENGQTVAEGQPIATVDRVTVMAAIAQVQGALSELNSQIEDARKDQTSTKVTASAGGTAKAIYAAVGEDVRDVMLRDGALAVLSLDGLMAVQVNQNTSLSGGDKVLVILEDDTEVEGRVESNLEGVLTVTVEDDGYPIGAAVKVTTIDGGRIGTGNLYVHNQWNTVSYSGTVSQIWVKEGDTVTPGRNLFQLKDTGYTQEFDTLTRQHREYEELMLELFRMYQSQQITAPGDGLITGVDKNGTFLLADAGNGYRISWLANSPNGNDETQYINYVGQVQEVGIDGLILKLNPQVQVLADYKDLSTVALDPALMTEDVIYNADAPLYELVDDQWVQIEPAAITAGDILLFAGDKDGNFVWVVRVTTGAPAPENPTDPTIPNDPSTPTDPTQPTDPSTPTNPSGGQNRPGGSGSMPSMGGIGSMPSMGGISGETESLYTLDTVTIATVTPQETMTIQITVDELDISKLHLGQAAIVTVTPLSGQKFDGTITGISASGENQGGHSKFTLEITVPKDADMLAGMSASVSITTAEKTDVLCIPVAALVESGTQTLVYRIQDLETGELTAPMAVTTGASDGEYVEILSGLSDGDTFYYAYYDTLTISDAPAIGSGFPFG